MNVVFNVRRVDNAFSDVSKRYGACADKRMHSQTRAVRLGERTGLKYFAWRSCN